MAGLIVDVDDAIEYINTLYESDETPPSEGDADYTVWLALLNIAKNLWEHEEGVFWKELFVKLADAADGDKTTSAADTSYTCPTNFKFPASGYVWLGSGTNKTAYKVITQEQAQLLQNDLGKWCYFLMDTSPTLEFNPNLASSINAGLTIHYEYYKNATKLTTGTDTFEMSDPMFAVYYALSELKKDEGDTSSLTIATQKMEGMKTRNITPYWYQDNAVENALDDGWGV